MSSKHRTPARSRRSGRFCVCALVSIALGCGGAAPPLEPKKTPNLLLITLDTVRADRLSGYGYARPTTPHLDRLALDGVRFDEAIAQAALTPVSHASILSGLIPPNHGLRVLYAASGYRLPEQVPTLAPVLAAAGFETGAFLSAFPVSEFFGFERGFSVFDNGLDHTTEGVMREAADGAWRFDTHANQRRSDLTVDHALAWLGDTTERPFFAWIHLWDPHDPWLRPPDEQLAEWVQSTPQERPDALRQLYDAELNFVDAQIGRILAQLKTAGHYDDTVIVVVADHGEGLGDHDHWHHRILYREQLRVPLILRIPGESSGQVIQSQVRTTDIVPTVFEALGVEMPFRCDGSSLFPLLRGTETAARPAYSEALIAHDLNATHLLKARPDDGLLHAYSDGEWKLIFKPQRPERSELYRLSQDPHEARNRYSEEPQVVARLLRELQALDPFVESDFGDGQDPDVLERLRSLGYVGE